MHAVYCSVPGKRYSGPGCHASRQWLSRITPESSPPTVVMSPPSITLMSVPFSLHTVTIPVHMMTSPRGVVMKCSPPHPPVPRVYRVRCERS